MGLLLIDKQLLEVVHLLVCADREVQMDEPEVDRQEMSDDPRMSGP